MNKPMEYKGYHAKIEYSDEDKTFVGRVLGINDFLVFEGNTVQELTEMFHNSIDDYLAVCAEIGKSPEREYKGSFNVRLSPELHKQAFLAAESNNMTLNQLVANAVNSYIHSI